MKIENFNKEKYELSKVYVDLFCCLYNETNEIKKHKARNNDSVNKYKADVVVSIDNKDSFYIEVQTSKIDMPETVDIYERRLNKTYDMPCYLFIHYTHTDECLVIGINELKELCKSSNSRKSTRHEMGKEWEETIYEIPKDKFKLIQLKNLF